MVKRIVALLVFFMAWGVGQSYAGDDGDLIEFDVRIIDNKPLHPGSPRTPTLYPIVWQDGYELEFETPHEEYVLNIVSGTTIVYTTVVASNVSSVQLPTTLSGTYELQLIQNNYCFYGYIEL